MVAKGAKTPVASEYHEQKAVMDWWHVYSMMKLIDYRLLFAIPNGAHLAGNSQHRAIQMNKLKASGFRSGVPDLMLAITHSGNDFSGLFIELKRVGGKPSPLQLEFTDLLRRQGYCVVIAQGSEEAIRAIKGYLDG